jgi:predicted nucleic acid-binding protein
MSVFVDTGVFYAAFDSAAPRHQEARSALTTVLTDAEYGRTTTSDYVYDETVTLTLKRTGRTNGQFRSDRSSGRRTDPTPYR